MKTALVVIALVALLSLTQASKTSKRCTWTLLRAISACKASCKVLGQTTGVCSPQDRCLCSGEDFDILDQVRLSILYLKSNCWNILHGFRKMSVKGVGRGASCQRKKHSFLLKI